MGVGNDGWKTDTLYECTVPLDQRSLLDDTPRAYRVEAGHGPCICIIYGDYGEKERERWQANISARWLVVHLLEEIKRLKIYENAVASMAEQFVDPKKTPEEMARQILGPAQRGEKGA
jgi:hypothetical protein